MRRKNPLKINFLEQISKCTIEYEKNKFLKNLSFNFQFFCKQKEAGQDFKDWNREQLYKLLDKMKEYCKDTHIHWQTVRVGRGSNNVLEIYGAFPENSDFSHPKHVPLDAQWARFRLEYDMRLIGFMVDSQTCQQFGIYPNIFYVVFLDENHKFAKGK